MGALVFGACLRHRFGNHLQTAFQGHTACYKHFQEASLSAIEPAIFDTHRTIILRVSLLVCVA